MDWDAFFQSRVLPHLGVARGGQDRPRWILVGGQPGAGKSTHISALCDELGPEVTQIVSSDALADLVTIPPNAPFPEALDQAFTARVQASWIDALVDRATGLRAHIVWERAMPGDWADLARVARALGYQVELRVIAAPLLDSWLATLLRDSAPPARPDGQVPLQPRRVGVERLTLHYHRWPGFLAEVEDKHAVDVVTVVNRQGEELFRNQLAPDQRWQDLPFAAESLLVERQHPRSIAEVDRMLADWQRLRARPDIAFANHALWPHADIIALGAQLALLRDDPSLGFDPNDPPTPRDPLAAGAWLDRLRHDIAAACAAADAPATLAPRTERLLSLVDGIVR